MALTGTDVEPGAPVAPVRRAWSAYHRGVAVLTVITFGWRAWTAGRWSWTSDDWLYMSDTRSRSFWEYLFQDYNGHLMPGEFLVSWVTTKVAPLEFWLPVVLIAATAAWSTWLWGRALVEVAGERLVLLAPLALMTLSPLMIRPTVWWASALQVLPLQLAMALVVLAAARLARTHERRHVAQLVWALVLGLVFWEKAVLLVVPATAVLLHADRGPLLARVRRNAAGLGAMALVVVAYVPAYLWLTRTPDGEREMGVQLGAHRSLSSSLDFFAHGFSDLLAPAFFGGPWHTLPVDGDIFAKPPLIVVLVCAAVVLLVTGSALVRVRDAWLPISMATGYFLVSCGLVLFSGRFDVLGLVSINDERYVADPFTVCVLAVCMVAGSTRERGRRARWPAALAALPAARVLGVALVSASLVVGNATAVAKLGTRPSRAWVENVTTDVARRAPVVLLDGYAPPRVLESAFFGEEARLSRMLTPLHADLEFGGPASQLWTVAEDGHLEQVRVGDVAHAEPGPVEGCGYGLDAGDDLVAPMSRDLYSWEWVVQVNAFTDTGGRVSVDIGGQRTSFDVGSGLSQTQFAYTGAVPDSVRLSLSESSGTVCVTDVVVGGPIED